MKKLYPLLIFLYLPFQIQAQSIHSKPVDQVKQTFMAFQSSIRKDDMDWPNKYVDSNSIQYFDHVLDLIHQADSVRLMEENYSTIFTVLYARYLIPKEKISSIKNSYNLIAHLNTSIIKKNLEDIVIRDIKIERGKAIIYTSLVGESEYIPYYFNLQKDAWKINLIIDNDKFEQAFTRPEVIESYGGTKEKIIEKIIHERNWDNSDKNLWQPLP